MCVKRPLAVASASFLLGIVAFFFETDWLTVASVFCISLMYTAFYRRRFLSFCIIFSVFFFAGYGRCSLAKAKPFNILPSLKNGDFFTVTVTDFSDEHGFYAKTKNNINIYVETQKPTVLLPGDVVRARLLFSYADAHKGYINKNLNGRNVFITAEPVSPIKQQAKSSGGFCKYIYSIRKYVSSVSKKHFSGEEQMLFSALTIGDKHEFTDKLREKLSAGGISHIAAVSGMHLSIILGLIMFLITHIFGKRRESYILAIITAIAVTFITGLSASVLRACVMSCLFFASGLFLRERDSITSLFSAAFVMALFNPYVLYNAGFVLSFTSTLGILLFCRKTESLCLKFMPPVPASAAALTISAQIMSLPAIILCVGSFGTYSLLTNILIFPFVTIALVSGIILTCISGVPVLSTVASFVTRICLLFILSLCELIQVLPYAKIG